MVKCLEIIIDRFGLRRAPSKIKAITQLPQPSTLEEVQLLLGMAGYLRKFVPTYISILAIISDSLRDSRFHSKTAGRLKVPWGQAQSEAMETVVSLLISHPSSLSPTGKTNGYTGTPAKQEQERPLHIFRKWFK